MNGFAAKIFTGALVFLLVGQPICVLAQDSAPAANSQDQTSTPSSVQLPDSPGMGQSSTSQNSTMPSPSAVLADSQQHSTGAAAAPAAEVTGNAVSRPAGSAIAPPKQRQVRSFLIKMGLLVGAGAALGTVAALSLSSPARVPGSH